MLKMAIHTTQCGINTELSDIAAKATVTSNNMVQQLYEEHRPTNHPHFSFSLLFKNSSTLIAVNWFLRLV